jgi:glycosyltransferase involved in cell wall biosynthesis
VQNPQLDPQSAPSQTNLGPGQIVHEWLEKYGGAENVVEAILNAVPNAPLICAWNDAPARFGPRVSETWLGSTPFRKSKALALPLMPIVWRRLGDSNAEWVLSVSHLFAHHARFSGPARGAKKLVYTYTPARYIWAPELDSRGASRAVRLASKPLQVLDAARAQEAVAVASISRFVAERVERTWHRESTVIYPPVEAQAIIDYLRSEGDLSGEDTSVMEGLPAEFILGASRFVPYKRLDLVIAAGNAAQIPVVLAGDGPDLERLRVLAGESRVPVTIIRSPSTALLRRLHEKSLVYVFLALEDFGITPVEAMASGSGVVALDRGGASETVLHGETGSLISSFDTKTLKAAVDQAASIDPVAARARALSFDQVNFRANLQSWMATSLS